MDVQRGSDVAFERGDDGRFAGEVWLRGSSRAPDGTNVGIVHFSPGARTHWHQHPGGSGSSVSPGAAGCARATRPSTCCSPGTSCSSRRASGTSTGRSPTARWSTSR